MTALYIRVEPAAMLTEACKDQLKTQSPRTEVPDIKPNSLLFWGVLPRELSPQFIRLLCATSQNPGHKNM